MQQRTVAQSDDAAPKKRGVSTREGARTEAEASFATDAPRLVATDALRGSARVLGR